ncbi:MAG: DinB family protein [Flammeovirgaceae bacterium]
MSIYWKVLLFSLTMLIIGACRNAIPDTTMLRAELKEAWQKSQEYTMTIANQMPAEYYSFEAADSVMTYAEQWRHCAIYTCGQLAGRFDMENPYAKSKPAVDLPKDSVIAHLKKMYAFVNNAIETVPDEKLMGLVDFSKGQIPGWRLFYAMENHIIHHRGQCIIYLRLKGIKPKGYYGW